MYNWKELSNGTDLTVEGYDSEMQAAGVRAEQLNESLAGIKGQLNARASRARQT